MATALEVSGALWLHCHQRRWWGWTSSCGVGAWTCLAVLLLSVLGVSSGGRGTAFGEAAAVALAAGSASWHW